MGAPFYIASTPVTFEQFDWFCERTGYHKPDDIDGRGDQPVINVNIPDALAFCRWLSDETGTTIRLPEENEWEYVARGGNKSEGYEYSGSNTIDDIAWYSGNSGDKTHRVGTKQPNELEIYDMTGNVWEWCGTEGALRGGSFDADIYDCLIPFRGISTPDHRYGALGFRVLQE